MPGGVMLQIGIHYVDVLEFLMGPVKRVRGASAHHGEGDKAGQRIRMAEPGHEASMHATWLKKGKYVGNMTYYKCARLRCAAPAMVRPRGTPSAGTDGSQNRQSKWTAPVRAAIQPQPVQVENRR